MSSSCKDDDVDCGWWAESGECEKNPDFMHDTCQKSCGTCGAAQEPSRPLSKETQTCEATLSARFAEAAAAWPADGEYDISQYPSTAEALDAYASFHAAKVADASTPTLVFTPNQYGLGNRLRAMKSALLVAMLTGRVFLVNWHEPVPLDTVVQPARIDWRTPAVEPAHDSTALAPAAAGQRRVICLPFATAQHLPHCPWHMAQLKSQDLRVAYAGVARLEVFTFTDLNIYLADNPHYEALLHRLSADCPKRMGCLFDFLYSPGPRVRERLASVLPPQAPASGGDGGDGGDGGAAYAPYTAVQVRNRLWRQEQVNLASRVVGCLARWVPEDGTSVFFTSDDDSLRPAAREEFGERFFEMKGGVYQAWSRGSKVDVAAQPLRSEEEDAVIKAFADWFALRYASLLVWTYGSSFSKTAAEASGMPNIDVNSSRCVEDEATGVRGGSAMPSSTNVQYDTTLVPGAKNSVR
tara:strand:+ start:58 stop:1458 length:1401 start_codon:yes stop_codon:yes gene_type:complete